jgi:hypothetical protein
MYHIRRMEAENVPLLVYLGVAHAADPVCRRFLTRWLGKGCFLMLVYGLSGGIREEQ